MLHPTQDLAMVDAVRTLAARLDESSHGQKGHLKDEFCQLYGWSLQKLHRELAKVGWSSERKRRADAGTTAQPETTITTLGSMLRLGVRKNGKATMEVPNAVSVLTANGHEISVGNSRMRTLLRQRQLDTATQRQGTPHVSMRSLHPNHVHQVDPSLCLLYYTPDGQAVISDAEAYKNKPEALETIGALKCWRYVLVDHYSNTTLWRYYQAKGESQANLWDFLLYCWRKLEGRPFHGVPKLLVWDKGSANTSSAIKNALKLLDVTPYEHEAGNPRCKGSVEGANNRVEKMFESRLKLEPVRNLDELNAAAETFQVAYNANRIPALDTRLHREGLAPTARFDLWLRIRPEQLRTLPSLEICRYLLSAKPETRKVRADLSLGYRHPVAGKTLIYDLRHLANVFPRQEVLVSPLVMGTACEVIVTVTDYKGEAVESVIAPVQLDEVGQRLDAPVWGQEFKRQPDTLVEKAGKRADAVAFPDMDEKAIKRAKEQNAVPFGGLDAHSHIKDVYIPDYLDRRGTELYVPDRTRVEIQPLSQVEACRMLVRQLGRALTFDENAMIRDRYSNGVPEADIETLTSELAGGVQTGTRPRLQVVK